MKRHWLWISLALVMATAWFGWFHVTVIYQARLAGETPVAAFAAGAWAGALYAASDRISGKDVAVVSLRCHGCVPNTRSVRLELGGDSRAGTSLLLRGPPQRMLGALPPGGREALKEAVIVVTGADGTSVKAGIQPVPASRGIGLPQRRYGGALLATIGLLVASAAAGAALFLRFAAIRRRRLVPFGPASAVVSQQ